MNNLQLVTYNLKVLASFLFLLLLTPKISNAQSSCCGLIVINRVDCVMELEIKCNGVKVFCSTASSIPTPSPWYPGCGTGCTGLDNFYLQPGTTPLPSTTAISFNNPPTSCPCDLEFTLSTSAATLSGNPVFNSGHTYEVFTTSVGCCPTITAVYNPLTCTFTLSTSCP